MKIYEYKSLITESGNPYLEKDKVFEIDGRRKYRTDDDIADFIYANLKIHKCAEEFVYVICMNNASHLIGCFEVSHGTANTSYCSPREIFQKALMIGATGIILCHNHPSGDVTPSGEDIKATSRVREAGALIGIYVLDHIIIGQSNWCSMKSTFGWEG